MHSNGGGKGLINRTEKGRERVVMGEEGLGQGEVCRS